MLFVAEIHLQEQWQQARTTHGAPGLEYGDIRYSFSVNSGRRGNV